MKGWIQMLRTQAQQIGKGDYLHDPNLFTGAPDDIVLLSGDLNVLAIEIAARDRTQQALRHEVHHRVKNNLQIVTSLLSMQASKIADPAAREALGQTRARMGALALIHRMLYEQTDDGALPQVNISRLMNDLCAQLRLAHRDQAGIDFSFEASASPVPLDSVVPLTLLSVEAVTNAYRHAFPEGRNGRVQLKFSVEGGEARLCISDNGIGYDANADYKSMGQLLMTAFAHQLGGKLHIESDATIGTTVILTCPVSV